MSGVVYQVLSDCPHCLVESAVIEVIDETHPASHLGVPVETRCRLCTWTVRAEVAEFAPRHPLHSQRCPACNKQLPLDHQRRCPHCDYAPKTHEVRAAVTVVDAELARSLLSAWAEEEGETDLDQFCLTNMNASAENVVTSLLSRQPVSTSFDVIAFLFPTGGMSAGTSTPSPVQPAQPPHPAEPVAEAPLAMDPRTPARVLVSVMVADGELRQGERAFVEKYLDVNGLEPFSASDLRVWRPWELGPAPPTELAHALLEAAVHLAHLDHQRDGSELRVIRAYAAAWNVSEERLKQWDATYHSTYSTAMSRIWSLLSSLVRVH